MKISWSCGHAESLGRGVKESPDGYKEWTYTNSILKFILEELENYDGITNKRIDDPTGKVDFPLVTRSNMVNSFRPDLHIDLHLNAHLTGQWTDACGIETFVFKWTDKKSVAIAEKVQSRLVESLGFRNRGVKQDNLHMLRETRNAEAKILIEFAFMTNKDEAFKMRTQEYQKKAALAVVDAIVTHYNLVKKSISQPINKGDVGDMPLCVGSKGDGVKIVHQLLFSLGYITKEDRDRDKYDDWTAGKVKQFQADQKLRVQNGIYDYTTALAFAQVLAVYHKHWLASKK